MICGIHSRTLDVVRGGSFLHFLSKSLLEVALDTPIEQEESTTSYLLVFCNLALITLSVERILGILIVL